MPEPGVELIRRVQAGDAEALHCLLAAHESALRVHLQRYVAPADAEDLLQELRLRVWQRAAQWDGRGRPLAWMLAIATNLALNHLRGRRDVVSLAALGGEDEMGTPASASDAVAPGPEEQALWRDELDRVRTAMAELPSDKQAALLLVRVEGYSIKEAAAMLGVPIGTLKSRLHHAHRQLMERFEEDER